MAVKNVRKFKYSENSLDGEICLDGARIRVLFRFAPERVAFIKSIKGARYEVETKAWTLPREKFQDLRNSPLFPEDRYPRRFSEPDLTQSLQELGEIQAKAREAHTLNPFAVDAHLLGYLALDVVFQLAKEVPQLRARVRFASKATAILTRLKGSHFLRSEGLFSVPTESLPALLLKLRDKQLSFAVEANCGAKLKASAELRKRILLEPDRASPQDLEDAFLTPYVDYAEGDGELAFALKHANSRHLAALFPDDENFHARKRKSFALNERDLLTLLNRVEGLKYPLYFSRAVRTHLHRRGLQLDEEVRGGVLALSEEFIPFLKTACAWVVLEEGRAGLLLDESLCKVEELSAFTHEKVGTKRFYSTPSPILLNFYQSLIGKVPAKETEKFSELLKELKIREVEKQKNALARRSTDAELAPNIFSDPTLVSKLFPHQRVAVQWLIEREYSMLGDDMGLGKTLSVIATIDLLLQRESISLALIVCPNSLVRNWIREARAFLPKRRFMLLPESRSERTEVIRAVRRGLLSCDALVINYERMRRPDVHTELKQLVEERSTLLCCDESQRIKNARSQTFIALKEISSACVPRIALTGTPTPRDVTDIWSQVCLLDRGKRFGNHYTNWLRTVAELGTQYSDFAVRKFKPDAVEETISRVHELLLRRKKEEVISLPEKVFVVRDCKLTGSQAIRYKEICDHLLLRIGTLTGGNFIKQIDNLLEEYLRAVQVASNPRLVDETWTGDPAKFLELDEIVDEVVRERGEKIVVWTNFLTNVSELVARYSDVGAKPFSGNVSTAERDATIQEFQNGSKVKMLVAVPAAGGVGITLTSAQTAVYMDKSWNAEHWMQSVDRLHRIGQRGTVSIISLSACKIDELISGNLTRKGKMQSELLGDNAQKKFTDHGYPTREELLQALSVDYEDD